MTLEKVFEFNSAPVRVVKKGDQPWFVAADVCEVLGLTNSRKTIANLEPDEKDVTISYTLGGKQKVNIISESGLYALIFQSRKPVAKEFRRWVTGVVLPEIRSTGSYGKGDNVNKHMYLGLLMKEVIRQRQERAKQDIRDTDCLIKTYEMELAFLESINEYTQRQKRIKNKNVS